MSSSSFVKAQRISDGCLWCGAAKRFSLEFLANVGMDYLDASQPSLLHDTPFGVDHTDIKSPDWLYDVYGVSLWPFVTLTEHLGSMGRVEDERGSSRFCGARPGHPQR